MEGLLYKGEHGNIRYAPRGLREQPDRLLVFTGRRVRILLSKRWSTVCKVMYYIALRVAPIFESCSYSEMVSRQSLKLVFGVRSPVRTFVSSTSSRLAQLVEHRSYEPKVKGSTPLSRNFFFKSYYLIFYLF